MPGPNSLSVSGFESQCSALDPFDGRDGAWFVSATGTTTVDPGPNEPFRVACNGAWGSCYAGCIQGTLSGSGYPTATIGFNLRRDGKAYDASKYRGITFAVYANLARLAGFEIKIPLVADTSTAQGGSCTTNCSNSTYMVHLSGGPAWVRYDLSFDSLIQQGLATPEPWDPKTILSVQWVVTSAQETVTSPNATFFFCVDEVSFIPR